MKYLKTILISIILIFSFCGISLSQTNNQSPKMVTFACTKINDANFTLLILAKVNSFTLFYTEPSTNKVVKLHYNIVAYPMKYITNEQGISYQEVNFDGGPEVSFSMTKRFDTNTIFFRIIQKDGSKEGDYYCKVVPALSI